MSSCTVPLEAGSVNCEERKAVLTQDFGRTAYYLICATLGLVILAMAANEWRRWGVDKYKRMTIAAAVLLLGRLVGVLLLRMDLQPLLAYQEWALESLTLAVFIWAFLFPAFATPRQASVFLAAVATTTVGLLALCFLLGGTGTLSSWLAIAWSVLLLLVSGFALQQGLRHRQALSLALGGAILVSLLGAVGGFLGWEQVARLGHLVALLLFVIEVYRTVLVDRGRVGLELQAVSERNLQQSQEVAFLLEVSRAIAGARDLSVVLERVSQAIARAVDADWEFVLLPLGDNADQLVVAAYYGWWGRRWIQDSKPSRRKTIRLTDFSLLQHACLRKRQIVVNQPEDYEQFERLHDPFARPQNGPALIQPIFRGERLLGILLLGRIETSPRESEAPRRSFGQADAELCEALAAQVATAIENAQYYQSVEEQSQRLGQVLRAREEKIIQFQAILESITDGVIVATEAGEAILVNAAAGEILGVPRRKLLDQTIRRLHFELQQAGGGQLGEQVVLRWGERELMGSLAAVKMLDETLLGYVVVVRDATEERQARQAKAEFSATLAGDLQTTLASITEQMQWLAAGASAGAGGQPRGLLDALRAQTERMAELVDDLAIVTGMERGAIPIEPRPVDMSLIIEAAVQAVRKEAGQVNMTVQVPPDLSPAWGDPQRLRQIVDNLLDNAVCYTPEHGRISVWAAEAHLEDNGASPRGYLVISIRDGGQGLPVEEQGRVFERFLPLRTARSAENATAGMGLAIAKSLVEAHGGRIWVEGQPGGGNIYSFTVPATARD
jgi:PAS domain S-box-containing protein